MPGRVDVVILGCGPAGLAAAEAAISTGRSVLIASVTDQPSTQYGCQYLHAPIPGHESVRHTTVGYHLNGTPDQYRKKVYGNKWEGKVSPEDFVGEHEAWDIRATYRSMWVELHDNPKAEFVQISPIKGGAIPYDLYRLHPTHIFSTIPAPGLCYIKSHEFLYHTIYANGDTHRGTDLTDSIVCDGTDEVEWYRNACVFGYRTTEWSKRPSNGAHVVVVAKPLKTNCGCHQEVHKLGRYGKWQKSYLVHQVWPEVMEILK